MIDLSGMAGYGYFGDCSFYTLDVPGVRSSFWFLDTNYKLILQYMLGHLNTSIRITKSRETFCFTAADSVHLGSDFRHPSLCRFLIESIYLGLIHASCPCVFAHEISLFDILDLYC